MIYRHMRFLAGLCGVIFLPSSLVFSGIGLLKSRENALRLPAAGFLNAEAATAIRDGGSLCFEFLARDASSFWILLQGQAGPQRGSVLVSRSPGFEDCTQLIAGSAQETEVLRGLAELAARSEVDERIQHNLQMLMTMIQTRGQLRPTLESWYLYERNESESDL